MRKSTYCPYCNSPSRHNPCWWYIDHGRAGGYAPCEGEDDMEYQMEREHRFSRNLIVFVAFVGLLSVVSFWWFR